MPINLKEFIKKYAFDKFPELYAKSTDEDKLVIQESINYLLMVNEKYQQEEKKKKIQKKK